ncbi:unnamed protein product [Fusarium graminearum]|nr:unnamed protein product [Fusarium graminearum]
MASAYGIDWWAQLMEEDGAGGADDVAIWLDMQSGSLEKQVLDYARRHMARFKDPSMKHYLDLMPEEHDDSYAERFTGDDDGLWVGLFQIVQDTTGPAFRLVWQPSAQEPVSNHHHHSGQAQQEPHRKPASSITRAICSQLRNIPEVNGNPAFRGVCASAELSAYIDYAVVAWASDRCRKAVESNESDDGASWSRDALQQIRMAYQGYEKLLSDMTAVVPSHDNHHQQQQVIQPPPSSSSLQLCNCNNEAQSTSSHSRLSNQFHDGHGNSHNATQLDVVSSSSPTRPTNQPQPLQGFVSINGTSKRQGMKAENATAEQVR